MSAAQSVAAQFDLERCPTFGLSATTDGDGSGRVTSHPSGIMCGTVCSATYEQGTVVTLTQKAARGDLCRLERCVQRDGGCTVTMNAASGVTATFAKVTRTLTVSETGTRTGHQQPERDQLQPDKQRVLRQLCRRHRGEADRLGRPGSFFTGWVGRAAAPIPAS
jgi:hypothetical protein